MGETPWRFKSSHPHHTKAPLSEAFEAQRRWDQQDADDQRDEGESSHFVLIGTGGVAIEWRATQRPPSDAACWLRLTPPESAGLGVIAGGYLACGWQDREPELKGGLRDSVDPT